MNQIKVRIAPSPTGNLHVGTARTAMFNWFYAKQQGGKFVLRLEDTDQNRSRTEYEENILDGLHWLGIEHDEFYRQSERTEVYHKYIVTLLENGQAFYCPHPAGDKTQPGAPHVCDRREGGASEGIIRLRNDEEQTIIFTDIIRGEIRTDPKVLGDVAIAISTDRPLFLLANAIDDAEMHISHVIRGEDHISNTPKQILIGRALGIPQPQFAHLPLLLGKDRSKLSKRHGAKSLLEYRDDGILKDAMVNFLALLGWHPSHDNEILTFDEILSQFSLERVQKGGAIYDEEKLLWLNHQYITRLSDEELASAIIPYLVKKGLIEEHFDATQDVPAYGGFQPTSRYMQGSKSIPFEQITRIAHTERARISKLSDIGESGRVYFVLPDYEASLLSWKNAQDANDIKRNLAQLKTFISEHFIEEIFETEAEKAIMPLAESAGRGQMLWPLRVSLSGSKSSPGPFEIMAILGKNEVIRRIDVALDKLV